MAHLTSFSYDATHCLGALILLMSFMLLYQRCMAGVINAFALRATVLAATAAW